jgi:hypothetical protein
MAIARVAVFLSASLDDNLIEISSEECLTRDRLATGRNWSDFVLDHGTTIDLPQLPQIMPWSEIAG